jgi:hypothetical protein
MSLCRLVYIGDGAEVLAGSSLEVSWLMEWQETDPDTVDESREYSDTSANEWPC